MIYLEDRVFNPSLKEQSRIAREMLLHGLSLEFGIRKMPEWEYLKNGKPILKDYPDIHFNISHCSQAVACALMPYPVGIDVEKILEFDEDLARFVSNDNEFGQILDSPDPAIAFTILWTKKESFLKLTGLGLTTGEKIRNILTDISCEFTTLINESSGYILTLCK